MFPRSLARANGRAQAPPSVPRAPLQQVVATAELTDVLDNQEPSSWLAQVLRGSLFVSRRHRCESHAQRELATRKRGEMLKSGPPMDELRESSPSEGEMKSRQDGALKDLGDGWRKKPADGCGANWFALFKLCSHRKSEG